LFQDLVYVLASFAGHASGVRGIFLFPLPALNFDSSFVLADHSFMLFLANLSRVFAAKNRYATVGHPNRQGMTT
jgi:hypothetical protein